MSTAVPRFGWIPDRPDYRDHTYAAPFALLAELPPRVDLRGRCPTIYNQGRLGSCTANAIAAALEFDRLKQKLPDFTPSRLFIYYNERVLEHTEASDSGAAIRDGIKSVSQQGDCPETEWPYNIGKFAVKPPAPCYADALKYKAVSYQRISHNLNQMKGCLADGYPFVFGITVYSNFPMQTKTGAIPMPGNADNTNEGHAMAVVGYDDRKRVFFIRNSWGTVWGLKGYGTIPYEYLINPDLSDDFWTIRLVS
ncbi:MAG: C1 family peptidase [Limisphaerales bacterium]